MGVYDIGQSVTISQTFEVLGVPMDPTVVTWTVEDPSGAIATYINGDPETANPSVGVFLLTLTPPIPGVWYWNIAGTGAVIASNRGDFQMLNSEIAPQEVDYPEFGPFNSWVDCDDVTQCCGDEFDTNLVNAMGWAASQVMFELSARQFTGRRERTVRPCMLENNSCWTNWANYAYGPFPYVWGWDGYRWGWSDGFGAHCGCAPLSKVKLPGYPVQEITEVKIDGAVVAADEYRLDDRRFLVRVRVSSDDPAPRWPSCQALDLPDTQDGTFSVSYVSGIDPPVIGKMAAAALACEFLNGCISGECALPDQATRIVRQGITIERITPLAEALRTGGTGLTAVNAFLAAYNPNRLTRRPSVYSTDGPQYARRVGQ